MIRISGGISDSLLGKRKKKTIKKWLFVRSAVRIKNFINILMNLINEKCLKSAAEFFLSELNPNYCL